MQINSFFFIFCCRCWIHLNAHNSFHHLTGKATVPPFCALHTDIFTLLCHHISTSHGAPNSTNSKSPYPKSIVPPARHNNIQVGSMQAKRNFSAAVCYNVLPKLMMIPLLPYYNCAVVVVVTRTNNNVVCLSKIQGAQNVTNTCNLMFVSLN